MVVGGLIFTGFSIYLLWSAFTVLKRGKDSKSWPYVVGNIIESEVVRYSATSSRRDFLVRYEYEVSDRLYNGNKATLYTLMHKSECEELAYKFPIGTSVNVYYNPNSPFEAVLVTGGREDKKYGELIVASLAILIGISVVFAGWLEVL